ncbi:hypothetical protein AB9F39_39080 [Rhizobium leguminosarum]
MLRELQSDGRMTNV